MTTNTFRVFCRAHEGRPLFSRSFRTFDEARRFLVSMLERKAQGAEKAEQEGNAAAFRTAAASWADAADNETGAGMLGDGRVYGIETDDEA